MDSRYVLLSSPGCCPWGMGQTLSQRWYFLQMGMGLGECYPFLLVFIQGTTLLQKWFSDSKSQSNFSTFKISVFCIESPQSCGLCLVLITNTALGSSDYDQHWCLPFFLSAKHQCSSLIVSLCFTHTHSHSHPFGLFSFFCFLSVENLCWTQNSLIYYDK